jgi:hypothetical protein
MNRLPRLAYLTTDPCNAATAEALAATYRLELDIVEPRDLPRLEREQADLVLDWDALPPDYQSQLLNSAAVHVVAIHSYNLDDGLASFLPARGILCGRRLDDRFVEALTAAARARAA